MISKKLPLYADLHVFLTIIATLILIGCLFIYSSSSVFALEKHGSSFYFLKRHCIGICVGLFAVCGAQLLPLSFLKKGSLLLFISSLFLVALTLFPSLSHIVHGSSRWLSIAHFTFQPSELLKVTLVLYLAQFLEKQSLKNKISFKQFLPLCIFLICMSYILLKQPDFGMTITLLLTTFILFFVSYAHVKHLILVFLGFIVSTFFLILFRPYRLQRILTFLNPWQDPKGSGFQIIQSLIAIGSGSWLGTGIAHSRQKFFYLPMQHTDFIFSIIAEETGLIGSLFLMILFMLFLYFGIRIAHQCTTLFNSLVIFGFVSLITLQALMNIAVVTGFIPTKGVGLPFISYGNTSLVCYLFMIGIIINIVQKTKISM